jgi:hypothetical protein
MLRVEKRCEDHTHRVMENVVARKHFRANTQRS